MVYHAYSQRIDYTNNFVVRYVPTISLAGARRGIYFASKKTSSNIPIG